jgi:hypothetical protein
MVKTTKKTKSKAEVNPIKQHGLVGGLVKGLLGRKRRSIDDDQARETRGDRDGSSINNFNNSAIIKY